MGLGGFAVAWRVVVIKDALCRVLIVLFNTINRITAKLMQMPMVNRLFAQAIFMISYLLFFNAKPKPCK